MHLKLKQDSQPKFVPARSIPFAIKDAVAQEIQHLESVGILKKVEFSRWATPVVPVLKRDGSFRICGDFKVTLNPALEVDQHPIPKPEDIFASLAGGELFTTLDLYQAYQQLLLDEESSELVTLNTHLGLYCYSQLPFGVASAPAIFQGTMDQLLNGLTGVRFYLDDIIITGKSTEEHLNHLPRLLEWLQDKGFRLKKDKCHFLQSSVEYLGHVIDTNGLHTTPTKQQAIAEARAPTNTSELRSFLGLVNYYGRFLPNVSTTLHPLNRLLQKRAAWVWFKKCKEAFQAIKGMLSSDQVLAHYNPTLPLSLAADASAYGVGAVISQKYADGGEHPIAYASRTLMPAEQKYAQVEKEALALVFGVKRFHQYLYGRHFTLITVPDHHPGSVSCHSHVGSGSSTAMGYHVIRIQLSDPVPQHEGTCQCRWFIAFAPQLSPRSRSIQGCCLLQFGPNPSVTCHRSETGQLFKERPTGEPSNAFYSLWLA